jgi:hypothetical protein
MKAVAGIFASAGEAHWVARELRHGPGRRQGRAPSSRSRRPGCLRSNKRGRTDRWGKVLGGAVGAAAGAASGLGYTALGRDFQRDEVFFRLGFQTALSDSNAR